MFQLSLIILSLARLRPLLETCINTRRPHFRARSHSAPVRREKDSRRVVSIHNLDPLSPRLISRIRRDGGNSTVSF
jgi:hypothetical protein